MTDVQAGPHDAVDVRGGIGAPIAIVESPLRQGFRAPELGVAVLRHIRLIEMNEQIDINAQPPNREIRALQHHANDFVS